MSDDYRSPTAAECETALLEAARALRILLAAAQVFADAGNHAGMLQAADRVVWFEAVRGMWASSYRQAAAREAAESEVPA